MATEDDLKRQGRWDYYRDAPSVKWSAKMDPTSWEPEKGAGSINVGHPVIARGIVRVLGWLGRALRRTTTEPT